MPVLILIEVETFALVKANFNAHFNVYSDISDAQTWKIVATNAVQCLIYSVHLSVWSAITGCRVADNGD